MSGWGGRSAGTGASSVRSDAFGVAEGGVGSNGFLDWGAFHVPFGSLLVAAVR